MEGLNFVKYVVKCIAIFVLHFLTEGIGKCRSVKQYGLGAFKTFITRDEGKCWPGKYIYGNL